MKKIIPFFWRCDCGEEYDERKKEESPPCPTCNGKGIFSVGMLGDICGDCYGSGMTYPEDIP